MLYLFTNPANHKTWGTDSVLGKDTLTQNRLEKVERAGEKKKD